MYNLLSLFVFDWYFNHRYKKNIMFPKQKVWTIFVDNDLDTSIRLIITLYLIFHNGKVKDFLCRLFRNCSIYYID